MGWLKWGKANVKIKTALDSPGRFSTINPIDGNPSRTETGRMSAASATSYDERPYPRAAYSQMHPDRLAVVATLSGLTPMPVQRCRVLELGCGDGVQSLGKSGPPIRRSRRPALLR